MRTPTPKLLGFLLLAAPAQASVLSSSEIESCVNDGSEELECEMRIVMTASLEHGQEATESAQFLVTESTSEGGDAVQLEKPLRVSWSKTPAHFRYPLRYLQEVNSKPVEQQITVRAIDCVVDPRQVSCDLFQNGEHVADSEGFCCSCGTNIFSGDNTRGNLDCSSINPEQSTHCLKFDELWYSVFEVGPPQVFYDIVVSIAEPNDPEAGWNEVTYKQTRLLLNHQNPVAQANNGDLRAELIGDFATAIAAHSFESKYLVIPLKPTDHELVSQENRLLNAMLVDKSMFDLSGLTCDKIGVSYSAFKHQSERCAREAQSCLANQLEDLFSEDIEREGNNQQPRYLVRGFCGGGAEDVVSGSDWALTCPIQQRHTTMLLLDVRASEAMFVTNVASGEIVSAVAPPFEAMQGGGRVDVSAVSTGRVVADFTIGIMDCSDTYQTSPAMSLSLHPYEVANHSFNLYGAQTEGGRNNCTAALYDALGALLDKKTVSFDVSDLIRNTGAQGDGVLDGEEAESGYASQRWTWQELGMACMAVLLLCSISFLLLRFGSLGSSMRLCMHFGRCICYLLCPQRESPAAETAAPITIVTAGVPAPQAIPTQMRMVP